MKKIILLLSEGFEILEASPFSDVFGWDATIGSKSIKVYTAGLRKKISSIWNFSTEVDFILEKGIDIEEFDAVVIPGGFGRAGFFKDIQDEKFKNLIREFYNRKKIVVGICTGTFALGEAGILQNQHATTYLRENGRYFNQLSKFGAIPTEKEIVIDKNLITSSAPKTALEVAFILLEKLSSKKNSDFIKKEMGF
jgi:4-methyl-5(b-hydroxyethyl)-thiazole monophosphate biosynthesis